LSPRGLAGRDGDQLTNAVACAWFGSPPNTDIEKKAPGTSEAFKELTILEESRDQGAPDPSILSQCTNQARRGSRKRPGPRGDSNRRAGTCHNAGWLGASWPTNQHVWLDGGEVTYCSFFDFAASKRPCLMTQRSSAKPAANARITINRIVSTPMPHAPRRVLIVTFEQENRPAV